MNAGSFRLLLAFLVVLQHTVGVRLGSIAVLLFFFPQRVLDHTDVASGVSIDQVAVCRVPDQPSLAYHARLLGPACC